MKWAVTQKKRINRLIIKRRHAKKARKAAGRQSKGRMQRVDQERIMESI